MEAAAPPTSLLAPLKSLFTLRTLRHLTLALAAAGVALIAIQQLHFKPLRATAYTRYRSHIGLMRLYDLQVAYRAANGTYAKDLEVLLASAEDGARLRENLKTVVDINTLVVVGDANRFRLEVNVLDPERTSVKIRGPL